LNHIFRNANDVAVVVVDRAVAVIIIIIILVTVLDDSKITVGRDLLCLFLDGAVS